MKVKKTPERMCVGCMEMKPKKELIRIVKNKENEIFMDITGKKPGRGAYICRSTSCLESAFKTKRLEKNLSHKVDEEIYLKLKEEIENGE
ncbi:RNase P modulator RnpM [Hathewaya massiliensis]|uniref:RNase P modulator RnpM n=1 Tax=Hathewaya massiliensis TaxID=1964382 RepID=UPI001157F039|nr:YlxR family protein [Hathewaya massiliensis]